MTNITGAARRTAERRPIAAETWDTDSSFYLTMALIATAVILVGFAPSFYLKSVIHAPPPLSALTMTHGLVFTAWMAVFVTQTALIAAKKPAPHRQLGMLGAVLFGAMITLACSTAITAGRLGHAPPESPPPLAFMALPLFAIALSAALVVAALWNRRRSDWHKRLMLSSFFIMTGPGSGRLAIPLGFAAQGVWIAVALAELLLAACIAYDYMRHQRVHPAYVCAAGCYAVFHVGLAWALGSPGWLAFAKAITA